MARQHSVIGSAAVHDGPEDPDEGRPGGRPIGRPAEGRRGRAGQAEEGERP